MARSGPQKIPGANLNLFFGRGRPFTGSDMEVNCALLHTTEGPKLYDYDGGRSAPTVTALPDFAARRLVWYQHFDVDESARALVNAPGGVETNTANVFQIELVGTCDPTTHDAWTRRGVEHIYWPKPPDWAVRDLAWLMRWLRDEHGIPLTSGLEWLPYPSSYGRSRVRMSVAQWSAFRGWCGHQHAPENDHGDPGDLPIERLLAVAAGQVPAAPKPPAPAPAPAPLETDMTPEQLLATPVPLATLPGGYVPTVAELLNGSKTADAALAALRVDLPALLLAAPMPDYAVLPDGYRPTVGEALNGAKLAGSQISALSAQVTAQSAAITALAQQIAAGSQIDPNALVARIEQAIAGITVHLTTKES
ncbi:hypothetical protein GCM10009639_54040 [Kitasatospora putterlickiae]|uniref:Uncharacterized protein n=1 Tax=Kitasatospora putterlickiae TaxID=221725 RepID=A0ABN1YFB7_9ACTN